MAPMMVKPLYMAVLIVAPAIMTPTQPMMIVTVNMHRVAATAMATQQVITATVITMYMMNVVFAMVTVAAVLVQLLSVSVALMAVRELQEFICLMMCPFQGFSLQSMTHQIIWILSVFLEGVLQITTLQFPALSMESF